MQLQLIEHGNLVNTYMRSMVEDTRRVDAVALRSS